MNNTQYDKTNELASSDQAESESKTHESELRQAEEYRTSRPASSRNDPEAVNQEEEDPVCDHDDVLRSDGV